VGRELVVDIQQCASRRQPNLGRARLARSDDRVTPIRQPTGKQLDLSRLPAGLAALERNEGANTGSR
jgi:hypothetical protein